MNWSGVAIVMVVAAIIVCAEIVQWLRRGTSFWGVSAQSPQPFGVDRCWLAIQIDDSAAVLEALGGTRVRQVGWGRGLAISKQGRARFVTPPIYGWVMVLGPVMSWHEVSALSESLGTTVQQFELYESADVYSWTWANAGMLRRHYSCVEAMTYENYGALTQVEHRLGLEFGYHGSPSIRPPSSFDVLDIAQAWSLDPSRFDRLPASLGRGWAVQL